MYISECYQKCNQDFAKRGKPKKHLAQKLPDVTPMLNKLMALKRITDGIVTKYLVTVAGCVGAEPPAAGRFLQFRSKKIAILTPF